MHFIQWVVLPLILILLYLGARASPRHSYLNINTRDETNNKDTEKVARKKTCLGIPGSVSFGGRRSRGGVGGGGWGEVVGGGRGGAC